MQKLRIWFATVLLTLTGVIVFGVRALAAPGTATGSIPPQACSTGTNGSSGTSGYVASGGSSGYTGTGVSTNGTGGFTTGSGGTGGTGGTGSSSVRSKHR